MRRGQPRALFGSVRRGAGAVRRHRGHVPGGARRRSGRGGRHRRRRARTTRGGRSGAARAVRADGRWCTGRPRARPARPPPPPGRRRPPKTGVRRREPHALDHVGGRPGALRGEPRRTRGRSPCPPRAGRDPLWLFADPRRRGRPHRRGRGDGREAAPELNTAAILPRPGRNARAVRSGDDALDGRVALSARGGPAARPRPRAGTSSPTGGSRRRSPARPDHQRPRARPSRWGPHGEPPPSVASPGSPRGRASRAPGRTSRRRRSRR